MKSEPKIAIVAALAEMDNLQAERVLGYVRSLLSEPQGLASDPDRFRRKAMREIRSALRRERGSA